MKKENEVEQNQEWDLKRIVIAAALIIVGVVVVLDVKHSFLDQNQGILGAAIQNKPVEVIKPNIKSPNLNVSSQIGDKIDQIKSNVSNIDPAQIATSSPQIQKVLRDIQGIKDLPADQAKQQCLKICSGI